VQATAHAGEGVEEDIALVQPDLEGEPELEQMFY
jgi:hypothetical protein